MTDNTSISLTLSMAEHPIVRSAGAIAGKDNRLPTEIGRALDQPL